MYEHDDIERIETLDAYEKPSIEVLQLDQVIRGGGGSSFDGDATFDGRIR